MNTIEEIASVHLGKAGDGSVVKPYVTPDQVDPTLLVAVPRKLNRTQYNIDDNNLPFMGYDVWNCYEFSTLLTSGYPLSGILKIVYPSHSHSIVESKSLKLYLNSFNMVKIATGLHSASYLIVSTISEHLSSLLGCKVDVHFHRQNSKNVTTTALPHSFWHVDDFVTFSEINFNSYHEDPSLLQLDSANPTVDTRYHTSSLRSNCRVTNQPDWGDVYVTFKGEKTITPDSFLQYIVSMRKENHFHEEICECIYKRLWDILKPDELMVACLYTRRGGIDINPVRASNPRLLIYEATPLITASTICDKTLRQ
jgi:7-cyano-7-deazaguanine reductase